MWIVFIICICDENTLPVIYFYNTVVRVHLFHNFFSRGDRVDLLRWNCLFTLVAAFRFRFVFIITSIWVWDWHCIRKRQKKITKNQMRNNFVLIIRMWFPLDPITPVNEIWIFNCRLEWISCERKLNECKWKRPKSWSLRCLKKTWCQLKFSDFKNGFAHFVLLFLLKIKRVNIWLICDL